MNPTIPQSVVDAAFEEDPTSARSEWGGQFRDDIGGWLPPEVIEAAVDVGVTVKPPRRDFKYVSFCDPSGGVHDSFTCAIAHLENDIAILDCLVEVRAPFSSISATTQISETLKSYGLRSTIGDKYAAGWVVDAFAQCGVKYEHSASDRSSIYMDVMAAFTSGRVRLLDNPRMITQFKNLERRALPTGRDRVDHPKNGKDDLSNATSGAIILAVQKPQHQPTRQVQINFMGR